VYVPPYPAGTSPMASGITYTPGAPPLSPAPGALPYSLDPGEKVNPTTFNASPYHANLASYAPQPYNLQPNGPQPYEPQPSAPMYVPGSYGEPPPSYSETLAQDLHQGYISKEEVATNIESEKKSPFM
ncbi:unnamed protein product, partial [Meganyctiphanes norvegica]